MPDNIDIIIRGRKLKQLICKNEDCRKIVGYEKIHIGIVTIVCPRCGYISEFKIRYGKLKENLDKMLEGSKPEKEN